MKCKYIVTCPEAAEISGVGIKSLYMWLERGIVRPFACGGGRGSQHAFGARDVICLRMISDLRAVGWSLEECRLVTDWLAERSIRSLMEEFLADRRYLILDSREGAAAILLTLSEVHRSPRFAPAALAGAKLAVIDVQAHYHAVMDRIRAADMVDVVSNPPEVAK